MHEMNYPWTGLVSFSLCELCRFQPGIKARRRLGFHPPATQESAFYKCTKPGKELKYSVGGDGRTQKAAGSAQGQPFPKEAVSDPKSTQWLLIPPGSSRKDGDNLCASDSASHTQPGALELGIQTKPSFWWISPDFAVKVCARVVLPFWKQLGQFREGQGREDSGNLEIFPGRKDMRRVY